MQKQNAQQNSSEKFKNKKHLFDKGKKPSQETKMNGTEIDGDRSEQADQKNAGQGKVERDNNTPKASNSRN